MKREPRTWLQRGFLIALAGMTVYLMTLPFFWGFLSILPLVCYIQALRTFP